MTPEEQASFRDYLRARTDAETERLKALRRLRSHGQDLARQMTETLADQLPEGVHVEWIEG